MHMSNGDISGMFIWQFADCRITDEKEDGGVAWWLHRPKCRNNKGIVDEYRRPKLAYDVVAEKFLKKI